MKESKEARKERQAREEWQFVECLRRAGNRIDAEVRVLNDRGWRVDYVLHSFERRQAGPNVVIELPFTIAIEIQGFGFGHVGRAGWLRDIDKAQAIAANGWLYVPVTRDQIANGDALEALARCGVPVEPKFGSIGEPPSGTVAGD